MTSPGCVCGGFKLVDIRSIVQESMEAQRAEIQLLLNDIRKELNLRGEGPSVLRKASTREAVDHSGALVPAPPTSEQESDIVNPPRSRPSLRSESENRAMDSVRSIRRSVVSAAEAASSFLVDRFCDVGDLTPNARSADTPQDFISNRASLRASTAAGPLVRFVQSLLFENICGGIICFNAVIIGIHAHRRATHPGMCEEVWASIFLAFNCVFFVEILVRMAAYRKRYFCGLDCRWNLFDILIVATGFLEDILTRTLGKVDCGTDGGVSSGSASGTLASGITILRILRVVRVVRMVKAFRTMSIFRELRIMVRSTVNCLTSLIWACVLLGFVHWCFSVYFVHLAADHIENALQDGGPAALENDDIKDVQMWFGSLWSAMFTLFLSITSGTNWEVPCRMLSKVSGDQSSTVLYMAVIALTVFAMLNVITGVFVDNATSFAKKDREVVIQTALKNKDRFAKDLLEVFKEADVDSSGNLSLREFAEHVEDPRVQAFLESLELDGLTAERMFRYLDHDNSGLVTLNEFVHGCMTLKGDAKTVDIASIRFDMAKMLSQLSTALDRLEARLPARGRSASVVADMGLSQASVVADNKCSQAPVAAADNRCSQASAVADNTFCQASVVADNTCSQAPAVAADNRCSQASVVADSGTDPALLSM